MINGVYACFIKNTDGHHEPGKTVRMDLKLCDQDESWGDGVRRTWTVSNMAPGDEFAFDGHFVEISGDVPGIEISCDYAIYVESQFARAFDHRNAIRDQDTMAKHLVITRCIYRSPSGQIDFLMDNSRRGYGKNRQWLLDDIDGDGRLTFYDLKRDPLVNLPPPSDNNGSNARFEISVMFAEDTGNEFQGRTFDFTMLYSVDGTGSPWPSNQNKKGDFASRRW